MTFEPSRPHISSEIGPAPLACRVPKFGALAQLGERLICIQEVRSSILLGSTKHLRSKCEVETEFCEAKRELDSLTEAFRYKIN